MLRMLLIIIATHGVAGSAAPDPTRADPGALQRLLVAEDARGKGADGVAPLLDGLRDADTLIRRVAVRAIGRLQRPDLGKSLLPILSDPVPSVRAEAANAIGQVLRRARRGVTPTDTALLSVRAAVTEMSRALSTEQNGGVRDAIAEAMGRLPLADSTEARWVEAMILSRAGPALTPGVAHAFYTLALARRVTGSLAAKTIELLRHQAQANRDTIVRRLSVLALGTTGALDSATTRAASRDADEQVRRLSLAGITSLDSAARGTLLRRAFADHSVIVRVQAVAAARDGDPRPDCAPIVGALRDAEAYVVLTALDSLGSPCRDSAAVAAALLATVRSSATIPVRWRWQSRAHALTSLAHIDRAQAMPLLAEFAGAREWYYRMYAARAAAEADAPDLLLRLARDGDHNVREAAIIGLAGTRKHDADDAYIAALASPGFQVVLAAAQALAGSPAQAAPPALFTALERVTALRSENARDPRVELLKRIGELGSAADTVRLTPFLADFDTTIAASAARTLSKWTGRTIAARPVPLPIRAEPLAEAFLAHDLRLRVTMAPPSGGGSFVVRLFADEAPATVARVVRLAREHFYDGHLLQRVEANFVVQGGGPDASEYVGDAAFMRDELTSHSQFRGTLGISARGRDTGDAQWYINLVDNPLLDHEFTNFGEIISGRAVAERIVEGDAIARVEVLPSRVSPPRDSSLVEELVAAEAALWNAWKAKDTMFYQRTIRPDAVFVSGGGATPRAEVIQQVIRFACTIDTTTLDRPVAEPLPGGSGALTVHATVAYTCNGAHRSAAVWSSTVFTRANGKWQIAFHQESSEPIAAPARQP